MRGSNFSPLQHFIAPALDKQPEKENASAVEQGCQTSAPLYCTTSYTWFPYLGTSLIAQSRKLHSSILQIINSSCLAFNKNVPNPIAGPKINKNPYYLIGLFGLGLLLNKFRFFRFWNTGPKTSGAKKLYSHVSQTWYF